MSKNTFVFKDYNNNSHQLIKCFWLIYAFYLSLILCFSNYVAKIRYLVTCLF